MEQTSAVDKAERTTVEEAALFCNAIRGGLKAMATCTETEVALPAEQRNALVIGLRDLAGEFEKARGDLLREGERG